MDEVLQKAPVIGAAVNLSAHGPVRLSAVGTRSMSEWVDFVRDSQDFDDLSRQQLVTAIYGIRKTAAEEVLTREMGRLGVITPADRDRLKFLLSDYSEYGQTLRRRAEDQAKKIIDTDRAFREKWAEERKAQVYPIANRHQINNELRQELQRRALWKNEQIANTEHQQGKSEAVADFYRRTKISDPEAEAAWYFTGPNDKRTCDRCIEIIGGNPYTQQGLIAKLASVGAMAPDAYSVHPHERHMADFRPSRGTMHKDENRDAAKGWARQMGSLQDHATGVVTEAPMPKAMPKWVETRMPANVVSNALRERVCGTKLWKWALSSATNEAGTVDCEALVQQQRGDWAARTAQEIVGGAELEPGVPFDFATEGEQVFDVHVSKAGDEPWTLSAEQHAARDQYEHEHGYVAHSLDVVLEEGRATVWHGEGVGGLAGREKIATVDMMSGAVEKHVAEWPWQRAAGAPISVSASKTITPVNTTMPSVTQFNAILDKTPEELKPMLYRYSDEELAKMKLYQVRNPDTGAVLDAGFAIKADGDMVNVCNNSGVKGLGKGIVQAAINAGATTCDHYDTPQLNGLYSQFFHEVRREPFDVSLAVPEWDYKRFDNPDIVYRELIEGLQP
jgi:hypothetical protein